MSIFTATEVWILLGVAVVSLVAWCVFEVRAERRRDAHWLAVDAVVEEALLDGLMAEACAREARARLAPLSDSEVAARIRKQMDENAAVRQLRADVDSWGVA